MSNTQLLSSGADIYAKKRKARQEQLAEVTFDPEARKEYLTGFHKRKVHRQNVARELAKQREHEEKLEARKEARAARKEMQEEKAQEYEKYRKQLKIKYGEALSDDEDDENVFSGDDEERKEPKEAKFKTPTTLTTVTVIEDMDQDDGIFGLPKNNTATMEKGNKSTKQNDDEDEDSDEDGNDKKKQRIGSSSATTAKGVKKIWPAKEKKKKFRYLHAFILNVMTCTQAMKEKYSARLQQSRIERVAAGYLADERKVAEEAVVAEDAEAAEAEAGNKTRLPNIRIHPLFIFTRIRHDGSTFNGAEVEK
ncbi:pre-60S ribosomal particles component [Podila epicladia]|nr:pre-60S ribosomal particles component [Podila epicladia]KAG0089262.1 pre-60S ribosomal particles component [Podila epicladia]